MGGVTMRSAFVAFGKLDNGTLFRARNELWLKVVKLENKKLKFLMNAFAVDPTSTVVDLKSGHYFDDATLVQFAIDELPRIETTVLTLNRQRART